MSSAEGGPRYRKVLTAGVDDLRRLTRLYDFLSGDALFRRRPLHESEVIRASLLAMTELLDGPLPSGEALRARLLAFIADERARSQQLHAQSMKTARKTSSSYGYGQDRGQS